jgi:hypothetical protein
MPLIRPASQTATHRVGLIASGAKRLRGHQRAIADAAVEHDGSLALDALRLRGELHEFDQARVSDVAGLVLVGLAHVDQLRRGVLAQPLGDALRVNLERVRVLACAHPLRLTPLGGGIVASQLFGA